MNSEEAKAEKFFERLWNKSVSKAISWFLIGILLFLIMILCMMPAQEIWAETEDAPMLMPTVLVMLTYLMMSFRVGPYDQYTENQKSRFMTEILKYHPIDRKAVWNLNNSPRDIFPTIFPGERFIFCIALKNLTSSQSS